MTPDIPIEFLVRGTAISLQGSARSRNIWKGTVAMAGEAAIPAESWALTESVAVTIYYFPDAQMIGDIDNIVKPILDAMSPFIYIDDQQIERLVVQRFEPDNVYSFANPTATLIDALTSDGPLVYIRVTDDPHEDLR